jgi:hypothetical protein
MIAPESLTRGLEEPRSACVRFGRVHAAMRLVDDLGSDFDRRDPSLAGMGRVCENRTASRGWSLPLRRNSTSGAWSNRLDRAVNQDLSETPCDDISTDWC